MCGGKKGEKFIIPVGKIEVRVMVGITFWGGRRRTSRTP